MARANPNILLVDTVKVICRYSKERPNHYSRALSLPSRGRYSISLSARIKITSSGSCI